MEEQVQTWVECIMLEKRFTEVSVEILGSTEIGEGYLGDITFVKVFAKNELGALQHFNYVIKSGKSNEELRKQAPVKEVYENETAFYTIVYPAFQRYQLEKNIEHPFVQVPNCAGALTHKGIEVLLLQDLNKQGFEQYNKKKPLNLNHLKVTLTHCGKMHALTFAIRKDNPNQFAELVTHVNQDAFDLMIIKGKCLDVNRQLLRDAEDLFSDDPIVTRKLKEIQDNVEDIILELPPDDSYNTINHGDCWSSNIMFKYEGPSKDTPTDVCFLDWQLTRLASPVCDLSYHIFVCASNKELDHLEELLKTYYQSFSDFLKQLGHDANQLFPYSKFIEHWNKHSIYGFTLSILVLKFVLCDKSEAPDFTEVSQDNDFASSLLFDIKDKSLYNQRVRDIINHFVKNNTISI